MAFWKWLLNELLNKEMCVHMHAHGQQAGRLTVRTKDSKSGQIGCSL